MAYLLFVENTPLVDFGPSVDVLAAIEFDCTLSETHEASAQVTEHPIETGANITDHVRPMLARVSIEGLITNTPINETAVVLHNYRKHAVPIPQAYPILMPPSLQVLQIDTQRQLQPGQVVQPIVPPITLPGLPRTASPGFALPGTWVTDTRFLAANVRSSVERVDRVKDVFRVLVDLCNKGRIVRLVTDLKEYPEMLITNISAPVQPVDAIAFSLQLQEARFVSTKVVGITKKRKPAAKRAEIQQPEGPKAPLELPERAQLKSDAKRLAQLGGY